VRRPRERGQALVELAITVPLLVFILLGIVDFARVYTAALTVEAAAREAADFGTQYPWYWQGDALDPTSNAGKTVQGMRDRACVAARHLTGYEGPDDACTNPTVSFTLDPTPAGVAADACWAVPRDATPCNVAVTVSFRFDAIVPLNIRYFDRQLGFPSSITLERTAVFAISDFELDEPLAPVPTAESEGSTWP
jgi:Flp pilus assembly protein TadG